MPESIWSDVPPTEPGWYWVLNRFGDGLEDCAQLRQSGLWLCSGGWFVSSDLAEEVKFGPRVPSAEELAALRRARHDPLIIPDESSEL